MKTLLGIAFITLATTVATITAAPDTGAASSAQSRNRAALGRAKTNIVAEKLGLSEEQKAQAKQVRAAATAAVKGIRNDTTLTAERKREQVAATLKAAQQTWQNILTAEQKSRLGEIKRHPRMLDSLARQRVRNARIVERIGLTAEQRAKIHDAQSRKVASLKAVRADAAMTPAQKKSKTREISQSSRKEIQALLTPEQSTKLAGIRRHILRQALPPVLAP